MGTLIVIAICVLLCGCTQQKAQGPTYYFCPVDRTLKVLEELKVDCSCGTMHTAKGTLTGRVKTTIVTEVE